MRRYEYDAQGFLIGWHDDPARPNSVTVEPVGIPPRRARWNGSVWVSDASRETQDEADAITERTRRQQAIAAIRSYDPATATAADVKQSLGAVILYLRHRDQELRP